MNDINGSIYSDAIDTDEDRGPGAYQRISIADNAKMFNMDHPRDGIQANVIKKDKKNFSTNEHDDNIVIL